MARSWSGILITVEQRDADRGGALGSNALDQAWKLGQIDRSRNRAIAQDPFVDFQPQIARNEWSWGVPD